MKNVMQNSDLAARQKMTIAQTFDALLRLQQQGWPGSRGVRAVSKRQREHLMRQGKWWPAGEKQKGSEDGETD